MSINFFLKRLIKISVVFIFPFLHADAVQVTHAKYSRLLAYQNKHGVFVCKVFDAYHSFPRFNDGFFKFALRTKLKLRNLFILRNSQEHSMIGPLEYFGTLTRADKYAYQISIGDLYPIIYRYPRHEAKETKRPPVDPKVITQVDAKWLSGLDKNLASTLAKYPKPEKAPSSLVQASGIFEMNLKEINLQAFDATAVDLTPFGASLVQNDQPFIMLNQKEDPLEAVTYLFGEKYAKAQIEKPVGLFLETHGFSQTITPLLKGCAGYVVLARRHGNTTMYDLIAVQIPFGFTLVVFKGAIHGDTTLKGKYLMCMTANHKTMATADVVFLKNRNTHDNVSINLVGEDDQSVSDPLTFSQESVYFNNSHQGIKQGFYDKVNGDAKMRRGLLPFSRFILVDKASVKIITECLLHRAKKAIKG